MALNLNRNFDPSVFLDMPTGNFIKTAGPPLPEIDEPSGECRIKRMFSNSLLLNTEIQLSTEAYLLPFSSEERQYFSSGKNRLKTIVAGENILLIYLYTYTSVSHAL